MRRYAALTLLVLGVSACGMPSELPAPSSEATDPSTGWREIESPVGLFSFAPRLTVSDGDLTLSWLEETQSEDAGPHHQLLVSRLGTEGWSQAAWVASGTEFFANWADTPGVATAGDDALLAHWLARTAADTYAYSIFLARSEDAGQTWQPLGPLPDDATPTEHGFVSYVPEEAGVRAFWLDGREMAAGGAMTLRTATIGEMVGPSELLDDRVCECCSTAAAVTQRGPVVVFRDRSAEETRDIGIVRREGDGWTETATVARDDWRIEGCPVNGPAVAASGAGVVVVWYTAGGSGPKVQIAFSLDSGESFQPPRIVDSGRPLGRVDVVWASGGAIVSWLEGGDSRAEIRLRRMTATGSDGESIVVARTSPARASGFPRLAGTEEDLYLAWVETEGEDSSRVRLLEVASTALN